MQSALISRFLEIIQIDRPSGQEQAMGKYISNWLTDMGSTYTSDKLGSILTTHIDTIPNYYFVHTWTQLSLVEQ